MAATVQKSLRIPRDTAAAIQMAAEARNVDFSTLANELLTEAVRMRRCPGIHFADGPSGRRARITGTGLEVWEVIATYQGLEKSIERLRDAYHWLSEAQLRAALAYYEAYPEEIDRHIARDRAWTPDQLREQHPVLTPGRS